MTFNCSNFFSHCQNSGEELKTYCKCPGVPSNCGVMKLVVFYFLECFSPLIGFINIYTLSTYRNKYIIHCCRMSSFSIDVAAWFDEFMTEKYLH